MQLHQVLAAGLPLKAYIHVFVCGHAPYFCCNLCNAQSTVSPSVSVVGQEGTGHMLCQETSFTVQLCAVAFVWKLMSHVCMYGHLLSTTRGQDGTKLS